MRWSPFSQRSGECRRLSGNKRRWVKRVWSGRAAGSGGQVRYVAGVAGRGWNFRTSKIRWSCQDLPALFSN